MIVRIMYDVHIFVCENRRELPKLGCADRGNVDLINLLKEKIRNQKLPIHIRVNRSGCLGQCEKGPVLVIYPQNQWHFNVTPNKLDTILKQLQFSNPNK